MESNNNSSFCSSNSSAVSSTTTLGSVNELVYLDKCKVCGKPASKKCGGCSLAFYCGLAHQKADWSRHKSECKLYEIVLTQERSDEDGKREGVYNLRACKLIPADTIIISEYPLIAFEDSPRSRNGSEEDLQAILGISGASPVKCFGCDSAWLTSGFDKLTEDRNRCNKCGLPFCGPACGGSSFHSEGDCRILQELGKKETRRGFEDMTKIAEDLRLLRIVYREKQKGTPISFRKGGSVMWARLMKNVKGMSWSSPNGGGKEEDDRIKALFPLSIAAVKSGISDTGFEVVRLMSKVLAEATLPVDPKNKRKRALFEKHCYLVHSCAPNLDWWIDTSGYHLKLKARVIRNIIPGETLTIFRGFDPSLVHNPTMVRRQRLQKLGICRACECDRCKDPAELGLCLSGIRCLICKDVSSTITCSYYLPSNPLEKRPTWVCTGKNCHNSKTYEQILVVTMKAEKELDQIWKNAMVNFGKEQCESVLTKLLAFISKHQRKILHPNHYLIMTARSRINRVVSHFLGAGEKLFLCGVTGQPRAYDYCAYKVEYLHSFMGFMNKLRDSGSCIVSGKIQYELVFAEAALIFRDYHEERMAGSSFFRRLHGIMDNLNKSVKTLSFYADCKQFVEEVKQFGNMLRRLLGSDFMSARRLKLLQNNKSEETTLRTIVKESVKKWSDECEEIGLKKLYISPITGHSSAEEEAGCSNINSITRADLHSILMDVPEHNSSS